MRALLVVLQLPDPFINSTEIPFRFGQSSPVSPRAAQQIESAQPRIAEQVRGICHTDSFLHQKTVALWAYSWPERIRNCAGLLDQWMDWRINGFESEPRQPSIH